MANGTPLLFLALVFAICSLGPELGSLRALSVGDDQSQAIGVKVARNKSSLNNDFIPDWQFDRCTKENYVSREWARDLMVPHPESVRPFSLTLDDFATHHPNECASISELEQAVRYGERRWNIQFNARDLKSDHVDTDPLWNQLTTKPSYFVPQGCHVPFLSADRICEVLSHLQHVLVLGDSLSRHVSAAIISAVQNDFVAGWTNLSSLPIMREKCHCDGQYSEHGSCRTQNKQMMEWSPQDYCSQHSSTAAIHTTEYAMGKPLKIKQTLDYFHSRADCSPNAKPILVNLQGGLHYRMNATLLYGGFQKLFQDPSFQACAKAGKLLVVWTSYSYNSPDVVKRYPHQGPANGLVFNQDMDRFLSSGHTNITTLDWFNLTKYAQTSDGVHFLTNANYYKAQYTLSIAEMMRQKQHFYGIQE